jgi:hypothetical protein
VQYNDKTNVTISCSLFDVRGEVFKIYGNKSIDMRVTVTEAFSEFLLNNNNVYPYSRLRPTRNTFFCKWVMLQGEQSAREGTWKEYFPVLANSLPNELLLELIMSGKAKPFPPGLSTIMDAMYLWGKLKNPEWYESAMFILDEALDNEARRKEIVRALISEEIRVEIHGYFGVNSLIAELLWLDWISWFNATYKYGPQSFRGMAMYCFDYIHWRISEVQYHSVL